MNITKASGQNGSICGAFMRNKWINFAQEVTENEHNQTLGELLNPLASLLNANKKYANVAGNNQNERTQALDGFMPCEYRQFSS